MPIVDEFFVSYYSKTFVFTWRRTTYQHTNWFIFKLLKKVLHIFFAIKNLCKKFGFNEFFFFFSSSCQDFVNLNSNLSGDFYFVGKTFEFDQFDESEKFFLIFLMYSCHHKRFDFNEKALGHGNTLLWLPSSHSLGLCTILKGKHGAFSMKASNFAFHSSSKHDYETKLHKPIT